MPHLKVITTTLLIAWSAIAVSKASAEVSLPTACDRAIFKVQLLNAQQPFESLGDTFSFEDGGNIGYFQAMENNAYVLGN